MNQLLRKASARGRRQVTASWNSVKRRGAHTLFRLPGLSHRDPRRRTIRITDRCTPVLSFAADAPRDAFVVVHPPLVVRREASIALDDSDRAHFQAGVAKYQQGESVELPQVFVASLSPARLRNADFLVSSADDEIVMDSAHGLVEVLEDNGILDEVLPPRPTMHAGTYVLLASPWSERSYYHWLVDALPRLSLLHAIPGGDELPVVVPSRLHRYHQESLEAAGIPRSRQVAFPDAVVEVDRLFFPALLSPTGYSSPHAVAWLRETFGAFLSTRKPWRRLYVSRRDARRRIVNEDEIIALLVPHGFEVVHPGDMSLTDQIRTFSEAQVVVGPHGAGLTNLIFSPEGATLVEFFGSSYVNGCFWALASLRRQRHAFATFETDTLDYLASPVRARAILRTAGIL